MDKKALQTYLPIIQTHFPKVTKDDVEILAGGYAHTVFKIHDQVFRFPKTKESEQRQYIESAFSKRFSKLSPIPIPVIEPHRDSVSGILYQTYEFIPGVPFTKEYAATLGKSELLSLAELFSAFLAKLHAVSQEEVSGALQPQTAEEYARYFVEIIEEDKKVIGSHLKPQEWEWAGKNIEKYYTLSCSRPFALKVTHADLYPKHILIDEKRHRLTGIIDFSLKVADPAGDFSYFDRYGDLFLKTVYEHYPGQDDDFDERRAFHARDFLVARLYLAVRDKNMALQNIYLKELHDYSLTHPVSLVK